MAAKLSRGALPSRSPSNRLLPHSSIVRPANMSGTQASSKAWYAITSCSVGMWSATLVAKLAGISIDHCSSLS